MAARTYRLTQQGQITDRYTKAIEQLGSDKLEVRLGGIYALERIANDSVRDRVTVAEVLAAFIRNQAPWPPSRPGQYVENAPIKDIPWLRIRAPDVHAALTVLGRRRPPSAPIEVAMLDLMRTDLRRADFPIGGNLEPVQLINARLQGALLPETQLRGAFLHNAVLQGAMLRRVQLQGAILHGVQLQGADFDDVQLQGAECDARTVWPDGFDWRAAGVTLRED
jgi:hypothetical protein